MPEAITEQRKEVSFSHLSLEEEIDKFHFKEGEIQEAPIVNISNAKKEADRHLSVHFPALIVVHLDNTSKEEEDTMTLNWENRSLRNLMA